MELNAVDRELALLQAHDFAFGGLGGDFEIRRQRFATNDQRMVTRRFERIWKAFKDSSVAMPHRRSFPMHQSRRGNNFGAENRADALMAETNTEDRHLRSEDANDFVADARILRPAVPGRNADAIWRQLFGFGNRDLVIAFHDYLATKHAEVLGEVVGKRVVVIDDQD